MIPVSVATALFDQRDADTYQVLGQISLPRLPD
jgi:hypothetical protein